MTIIACHHCGEPFRGRPNRCYCSSRCRRRMEAKRHRWDMLATRIEWLKAQASEAEPETQASIAQQMERLRAHLIDTARP